MVPPGNPPWDQDLPHYLPPRTLCGRRSASCWAPDKIRTGLKLMLDWVDWQNLREDVEVLPICLLLIVSNDCQIIIDPHNLINIHA